MIEQDVAKTLHFQKRGKMGTWQRPFLYVYIYISMYIYIYYHMYMYIYICIYICINTYNICVKITKGRLAPKLPSCGWMSRGSLVIMSTTEGARAVRAWERQKKATLRKWMIHRWKRSRARNPVFLWVWWPPGHKSIGSVFPRVRASLGQSPTESARDCSERSVCTVKGCRVPSCTSGRRGRKHAHETARARFAVVPGHVWKMGSEKCAPDCSKKRKTSGVQRRVESFPLSRSVAIVDLRDTPAMRVCKWCVKTHWHGSESISGTATLIIVLLLYCAGL